MQHFYLDSLCPNSLKEMSSARRVADVPEIIASVAGSLSDRRPLLLVSKHVFRSVAPLIWKNVRRVDQILRLIPGITERRAIRQYSPDPDAHAVIVVSLSILGSSEFSFEISFYWKGCYLPQLARPHPF